MSAEKSMAIVLKVVEFSETSLVTTLFTEDFGKISALAKGARRPKSPFEAALDLLAVCRIVFLHKSSDALDLLTEARLERRFRSATSDLTRLYAGYYVAELLREMTDEKDPHPALFQAASDTLAGLDLGAEVGTLVLRFELTALRLLGHLPSLNDCVECGRPIQAAGQIAFGQSSGGVLCDTCRTGKRHVVRISAAVLEALRAFADADASDWQTLELERRVRGELRGVLNHYLSHLLGHRPRMHQYLGVLAG